MSSLLILAILMSSSLLLLIIIIFFCLADDVYRLLFRGTYDVRPSPWWHGQGFLSEEENDMQENREEERIPPKKSGICKSKERREDQGKGGIL